MLFSATLRSAADSSAAADPRGVGLVVVLRRHVEETKMRVDSRFTVAATAMPARLRPQLPPGDGVWLVAADGDAPPAGQIIGTLATGDTVWLLGWDGHLYTEWGVLSDGTPSKVAAGSGVVLGPNGAPLSFGSGQKGES